MFNLPQDLIDGINQELRNKEYSDLAKNNLFDGCKSCQDYCHNHCSGDCGGPQKGWTAP